MKKMASIALALGVVVLTSEAGVKYWDNPVFRAFDVSDYAPDALWFFDGIRNQGASEPHSTTATTWKNLGSTGAGNDMFVRYLNQAGTAWANSSAPESLGTVNGRNLGSWTENGFVLTGDSEFRSTGPIDSGTNYTIQMLVEATVTEQKRASSFLMSVAADSFSFFLNQESGVLNWRTQNNHPQMSGYDLAYVTAILDGEANTAAFFRGTEPPTSGIGFKQYSSVSGKKDNGYCIGGSTQLSTCLTGTIYCYRYYKRVLTHEELMWNRVLDEARYFGRKAPLPATNVVVTANYPRVGGFQPNGNYYVDSGEFTVTAPASTNMNGRAYTCTGYTLETWDDAQGVWSDPVSHDSLSYTFADPSAKVRVTWQWTAGDGLVVYDVNDYVWDGLLWFYDGIRNAGRNAPHDSASVKWTNLGYSGSVNDLSLQVLNAAGDNFQSAENLEPVDGHDPGSWTDYGFKYAGSSRFRSQAAVSFGTDYTMQMLVKASSGYVMSANWEKFSLYADSNNGITWRVQTNDTPPYITSPSGYATAILDGTDSAAKLFNGVTPPSDGDGFKQFESLDPFNDVAYNVGGAGGTTQLLNGTLRFFRYYDRVLTEEEIEWNRLVDNFRYFGPPVTNVVVTTTHPLLMGNEAEGPYEVSGAYTFSAPASLTAKGITYTNDGYTVETWDGSAWANATSHDGNSYPYSTSAGMVRLTWKWKAAHGMRTAADYSYDDYSQAGLIWNYDGILNVGVDNPHSTNTTTWVNLGSAGAVCDLSRYRMSDGDLGEWKDGGYEFRGHTRYRNPNAKAGPFKSHTLQILMDARASEQIYNTAFPMSVMYDYMAFVVNKTTNRPLYWQTQGNGDDSQIKVIPAAPDDCGHLTAIFDYDAKTASFFAGTTPPVSGTGFHQYDSVRSRSTTGFGLGCTSNAGNAFTGILNLFRCYDRVLTQDEVTRNINADAVRYYGALATTNVLVVAGESGTLVETACKVEGEWTFSAQSTVNARGDSVTVKRYSVEELVNGAWTNKTVHDGTSYTYVEGTSPASVRLIWLGPPSVTTIIVR